jgi:hypothetical protein
VLITPKFGNKPNLSVLAFESPDLEGVLRAGHHESGAAKTSFAERVREKHGDRFAVDMCFTPAYRTDILSQQIEGPGYPAELAERFGPDAALRDQFHNPFTGLEADIVVLSILPDIRQRAWRHRSEGYLLTLTEDQRESLIPKQAAWFDETFEGVGRIGKAGYQEAFGKVVRVLKKDLDAHVILFGCSSIDLDDLTHNHHDLPETLAYRAALFNTEAIRFSFLEGISIVDVDRLVAEIPGENKVPAVFQYSEPVNTAVLGEFFRIVDDIGFFEDRPLLVQAGQGNT